MDCNNVVLTKEASTATEVTEVEQKQINSEPFKKHTKEEKARKKDDKSIEQVLKALNSLETTEEKLAAMCKKYSDILEENRKLQLTAKQAEKRMSVLQREKEQLQTEHSKAVLTRSRLESLCRELQRQNKAIKDESLLKIREEEEKRKDVSTKFQSTLNEITALMQQNNEKNSKLREDNIEMTKKFKTVCEQYEIREQQVEKITKQMKLEAQLADAKLAKAKMEMAAEKEVMLKEKQRLLLDLTEYQSKCRELQTTEVNLRSQISLYTDKYDEFQNALSRSNEVFGGFKGEMEKMSKKICKLEKETTSWKQRWEKSHQALLEMAADKQQRDNDLALATRQLAQLQKLCRTLQAERTLLLAQLKNDGITKPTNASSGDATVEVPALIQEALPDSCCLHTHAEPCKQENHTPPVPKTKKNHKKTVQMNEQKTGQENGVTSSKLEKSLPSCTEQSQAEQNNQSTLCDTSEEIITETISKLQTLKADEEPSMLDAKTKAITTEAAAETDNNPVDTSSGVEQNNQSTLCNASVESMIETIPKMQTVKSDEEPAVLDAKTEAKIIEIAAETENKPLHTCKGVEKNQAEIIPVKESSVVKNSESSNNKTEHTEGISVMENTAVSENISQATEPVTEMLSIVENITVDKITDLNTDTEQKENKIVVVLENIEAAEKSAEVNCISGKQTTPAGSIVPADIEYALAECIKAAESLNQAEQHPCLESTAKEEHKSSPISLDSPIELSSIAINNASINERLSSDCQVIQSQGIETVEPVDNMISLNVLTDLIINEQKGELDQLNNPVTIADSENNIITNQTENTSITLAQATPTEANVTATRATKTGNSDCRKGRDGGKKRKNK